MSTFLSVVLRESAPSGSERGRTVIYVCPGCDHTHMVEVEKRNQFGAVWRLSGSLEKPTLEPSVDCAKDYPHLRCHHFVRNGCIEFLSDCHHALAGKTVPMVEFKRRSDD